MVITQRFDNVLSWGTAAASTSAAQLFDSTAAARTATQYMQGVQLTNDDTTATIYLGYDSTVTSSKYWKKLGPGEFLEELMGRGVASKLYFIASTGTPNLSVAVLG